MRNIFLTAFIFLVLGYSTKTEELVQKDANKKLKLTGTLELPLDENSIQKTANLQYFTESGKSYLAHFNKPDNSIKILSLDDRSLTRSIQLNTIGPNAVIGMDSSPENFKIVDPDSIYIYSTSQEKIFLINSQGEIRDTWLAPISSLGPKYPSARLNTFCSLIPFDEHFLLTSQVSWYPDGQPPLSIISLDKKREIIRMPEEPVIYQQFDVSLIGDHTFFKASNTMTSDGTILISYPLEHRVMSLSKDLEVGYHELQNIKLGTLKGFGKKMTPEVYGSLAFLDFLGTAPVYHAIIADPYNEIIYRIGRLPFAMEKIRKIRNGGEPKSWDFSIMIYNNNLELLGETTLVNTINYDMNSIFVSPDGLHIQRISTEEDKMLFDIFQIVEEDD